MPALVMPSETTLIFRAYNKSALQLQASSITLTSKTDPFPMSGSIDFGWLTKPTLFTAYLLNSATIATGDKGLLIIDHKSDALFRCVMPTAICTLVTTTVIKPGHTNAAVVWQSGSPIIKPPQSFTEEQWQLAMAFEQDLPAAWFPYVDWLLDAGWPERAEQVRLLET